MKSYPGHQKIAFSGYLVEETGELISHEMSWFNYESVIDSIRKFLHDRPLPKDKKYYLVMDNAPWHKKAKRLIKENEFRLYQDINDSVVFVYLPPYSPDLNPIEQVWRKVRREITHNRFFKSIASLNDKLLTYFRSLRPPSEELKSLCSFKSFMPVLLLGFKQ